MPKRLFPIELHALVWLGTLLILGSALGFALPHGPQFRPDGLISKAAAWDAELYEQIALRGYREGQTGAPTGLIALFPAWPIIDSALLAIVGNPQAARGLAMLVSGCAGIVSVISFCRLARSNLPTEAAALATLLYALYPGAHFLFQPYPTALMQLCTILVVQNLVDGRLWRAAVISGVATAFGPLMVFNGIAIIVTGFTVAWRDRRVNPRAFQQFCLYAPILGTVALSGLLLFMLWQAIVFRDPFAFIAADTAWGVSKADGEPMTLAMHAKRALALALIIPDLIRTASRLQMAVSLAAQGDWSQAQISFEDAVDLLFVFLLSSGAIAALRLQARPIALAAILVIAGFIWFAGAPKGGQAAIRLLYPAVGGFLGLASLVNANRALAWVMLLMFAAFLLLDQAFLVAGYWVV